MSYDPVKSLQMGRSDLGANAIDDVVSLRIEPEPKMCCCSHCWPLVWQRVNERIHPQGPVQHDGRVLLQIGDERLVLESHESGPEIVIILAASINLVSAVLNLVVMICNSLSKDKKCPSRVNVVKRKFLKGRVSEEIILQVDAPIRMSDKDMANLRKVIQKALSKNS